MQICNLCNFEPAGQTAHCIGFLAMSFSESLFSVKTIRHCYHSRCFELFFEIQRTVFTANRHNSSSFALVNEHNDFVCNEHNGVVSLLFEHL
jgi:hypothetical protein